MGGYIELDGQRHGFARARLRFEGSDWTLTLHREGAPPLELAGEADGDRLRIDLRSLDEVLGALQGRPITAYPGGQLVNRAFLDVRPGWHLDATFEIDWDRAIDQPGASYVEPRRVTIALVAE